MSIQQTLVAAGAECVGGDLILNREVLAQHRGGVLTLTLAGHAWMEDQAKKNQAAIVAVAKEMSADPDIGDFQLEPPLRRGRNKSEK